MELTTMKSGRARVALCCSTAMMGLGGIFCIGLFGLSIAEIVMGAKYLNDCPKERMIPIYLIGIGIAGILTAFREKSSSRGRQMTANAKARRNRCQKKQCETPSSEEKTAEEKTPEKARCGDPQVQDDMAEAGAKCCDCLGGCVVGLFALGWFIAGHVWVFQNQDYNDYISTENGTEIASSYCDPTLYKFAYWSIIGRWIAIGAFMCLSILVCCGACCFAAAVSQRYECFENEEDCEQPEENDVEKAKFQDVQLSIDVESAPVKVMALGKMKEGDDPKV